MKRSIMMFNKKGELYEQAVWWDHLLGCPLWALTRFLMLFFPKSHPWYGKRFSLNDWCVHRTPIVYKQLDAIAWIFVAELLFLFYTIYRQM